MDGWQCEVGGGDAGGDSAGGAGGAGVHEVERT